MPPIPQALCLPLRLVYDEAGGMDCLTPAWLCVDETQTVRIRVDARDFGYDYVRSPQLPGNKAAVKAAEKVAGAIVQLANNPGAKPFPTVDGWRKPSDEKEEECLPDPGVSEVPGSAEG